MFALGIFDAEVESIALTLMDGRFGAIFFFTGFLLVRLFVDFDPMEFFRFGDVSEGAVASNFLFVPPGVVTIGASATVCAVARSGVRLVDETTLVALIEVSLDGCTVGATPADALWLVASSNVTERLLNDVDGRNAPNPSSTVWSFFPPSVGRSEEPNSDGISFKSASLPPPTTAALYMSISSSPKISPSNRSSEEGGGMESIVDSI